VSVEDAGGGALDAWFFLKVFFENDAELEFAGTFCMREGWMADIVAIVSKHVEDERRCISWM